MRSTRTVNARANAHGVDGWRLSSSERTGGFYFGGCRLRLVLGGCARERQADADLDRAPREVYLADRQRSRAPEIMKQREFLGWLLRAALLIGIDSCLP